MNQTENENIVTATVKSLANEIEYQSDGIVSKQIIKKPNGNITLFAFDKDESLTEHTSPYEAIAQIIEGERKITIGGSANFVKGGEMIIMPPNIPHGLVAVKKTKILLTMIK